MPINQLTVFPLVKANLVGLSFSGFTVDQIAAGLASGICNALLLSTSVVTQDTGSLGVGYGVGSAFLKSEFVTNLLLASLPAESIGGVSSVLLANAVGMSISGAVSCGVVNTTSPLVGSGVGIGSIVPTSSLLYFNEAFASVGMSGLAAVSFARAISIAFDSSMPSTFLKVDIMGSGSPLVALGIGTGSIS